MYTSLKKEINNKDQESNLITEIQAFKNLNSQIPYNDGNIKSHQQAVSKIDLKYMDRGKIEPKNAPRKSHVGFKCYQDHTIIKKDFMHTMGSSLYRYLSIKIHNYIHEKKYNRIIVIGDYNRDKGISNNEKDKKLFNWQRPTAELIDNILYIKCAPGIDYVKHYASIVSSYLALIGGDHMCVSYIPPTEEERWNFIANSNLKDIKVTEFVIYGFGLPQITESMEWKGSGPFKTCKKKINNAEITFLGCEYCVWGDITSSLVRYLAEVAKIKKFIYIGKVGSINPNYPPNQHLATGNISKLNDRFVKWNNIFENIPSNGILKNGIHYTIPSTLMETKKWLERHRKYDFIDPEIGHMAYASLNSKIQFGYMHIISDNLSKKYSENLSNERMQRVLKKREILLSNIRKIIEKVT